MMAVLRVVSAVEAGRPIKTPSLLHFFQTLIFTVEERGEREEEGGFSSIFHCLGCFFF